MVWLRSNSLLVALVLCGCQRGERVDIDGEWSEPQWNHTALRGVFADGSARARPYSEIRLFRDETFVYVGLYAADEDIRSTDHFDVDIGSLAVSFTADGAASDPRVRAAVDRDGTLDDPDDNDEEWLIEAAIPRSALSPPPWHVHASRCDVTHAGERRCGAWDGSLP